MHTWEQRVTYPDGAIALYQQSHNARYYKLKAEKILLQRSIPLSVII